MMTPTQAVALRALWLTLAENGNLLARSWAPLVTDVDPNTLITVAERLSSRMPKLYADTAELIVATGAVLEEEGTQLVDHGLIEVPPGAGRPTETPTDTILDEILDWEPNPNAD